MGTLYTQPLRLGVVMEVRARMDQASVAVILCHLGNDAIAHPHGDGVLVDLPMCYSNGDRVRLLVEPSGDGYRVTDRGEAAARLVAAGLALNSKQALDVLADVIHAARLDAVTVVEQGELSVSGPGDELGRMLAVVACASLRVDELQWLEKSHGLHNSRQHSYIAAR